MKRKSKRRRRSVRRGGPLPSADQLELQRDVLLGRLARLHVGAKRRPGYRTALRLLNSTFRKADLATRAAILQAAGFMVQVLEMTRPF
jgi:hypothetical protein